MSLKKIRPGSVFPDQQLYTRISVSTKYEAGSFMNNDLKTPAAPSEGNCVYDKCKDESWKQSHLFMFVPWPRPFYLRHMHFWSCKCA